MTAAFPSLAGKVAVVTGASSGLGRHFAKTLAGQGVKVAAAARRIDELARLCEEIAEVDGRAIPVGLDVTDAKSVHDCLAHAETELGPIAILVNNAGLASTASTLDVEEEEWDRVVDTNLKGVWLMAQAAARLMADHGHGGAIINIASVLGLTGSGKVAPYCASKAAVVNLTRAMAADLARHNIRVNALAPGYFETDINRDFLRSEAGKAICERIPQRRFGKLDDLDGALLLLASEASHYMTGSIITVDGGQSAIL